MSHILSLLMEIITYILMMMKNLIHKYYSPFLPSRNNEHVSSGSEYNPEKQIVRRHENDILYLLLNKSKRF